MFALGEQFFMKMSFIHHSGFLSSSTVCSLETPIKLNIDDMNTLSAKQAGLSGKMLCPIEPPTSVCHYGCVCIKMKDA